MILRIELKQTYLYSFKLNKAIYKHYNYEFQTRNI
jgi:hypothetical protein